MALPGFISIKKGMTQVFDETGNVIPVTVLELLPLTVTQIKSDATDGYSAVQVGAIPAKDKHLTKPQIGHFAKSADTSGGKRFRLLKEFRIDAKVLDAFALGQDAAIPSLEEGMQIRLTSKSKGKGTMGGIRRWGHRRGPMSHGSKNHRLPGSIGAGTTPSRVYRGLHMSGKTGNATTTFDNIRVVKFIEDKNLLLVKGSVAGPTGALVVGQVANVR